MFFAGSRGRSFIVLFMANVVTRTTKNIYVTSENGVQINITTSSLLDPNLKVQIDRTVFIPSNEHIILPTEFELESFKKEVKSVLIETSDDVFVISHDDGTASVGSTTHIPLHKLSTKYIVISTEPYIKPWKSQLAVAAIKDNTTIFITFKMKNNVPLNIGGYLYRNDDMYNITLDRLETYQISHSTDLTGTVIRSSFPIAAFSGNDCNTLDSIGACDHLIEQLPPTTSLDRTFLVPPNSVNRDTKIRITAVENCSMSYTISGTTKIVSLNEQNSFDTYISSGQSCYVESKNQLIVTSFGLHSKSTLYSQKDLGDPSMTLVPGIRQYLDYYKIVVPTGYVKNCVSVMIEQQLKDSVRINNNKIDTTDVIFEENVVAENASYNVRLVRVSEGELTVSSVGGERFGLLFSGVTIDEAYGFSGNSLLL